jgi:class 3 adenylate cyclase
VRCGQCGASSGAADRFCGTCGASLGGCPSCGEPVVPGDRFCRACGFELADGSAAGQAAAPDREPVAERRVCSVLFCDLVGFTPLSESRDPEAVRELLSRYFGVARTMIGRYGGTVEKFIGDAVMAVWGTPAASEDDAERAVRAALDLVAAVAALGAEAGLPGLAARAGVVTGEMAVNLGAVGEGMVAGDAVNTAARVQATAGPGQVLTDAPTQRLAGRAVGFADAGQHTLKGKAEPQPLWRATRVLSGIGGQQRMDGLEAPLVGRDAELRTIKELFHAAAERRVPRLVLVSGPAGVGKSRLDWEFWKYVDGLAEDVWWHRGHCLSYGEGVAFWALAEIVRQRLGIAEEDPAETAAAKLKDGLERFVPEESERAYVGNRLGRLLGVSRPRGRGGPLTREELFGGWRLFFERLAAVDPVVLVIEDAQYADTGLLDFLDHLIDWTRDLPIYVLVFARTELHQARPGFGVGRNRSTLTLDPLDRASMDRLVDALVPGMPPAARAKITGQAQGVPLFAVETVRALIDRDVVQPCEGVYRLVGDFGDLAVPDSLHALLAARLDALDPGVRRLVTDAAVLGTSFPAEALIAVSGKDEQTVRAALAELVHREVLAVSADPLSPERGSYQFAQQMLRQVAYDTLSRRDRKTRHLKVAAHLRTAFAGDGEEVSDVIARHYLDALAAAPEDHDAERIRAEAAAARVRAAERAERTGALAQAAASYASAAELTPVRDADGQQAAGRLWERATQAAVDAGDYAAAVRAADRARAEYRRCGQARAAARVQVIAGNALRLWGHTAEARDQLTTAMGVLRADPDRDTVRALDQLATVAVFSGSADADQLTAEALDLGQDLDVDAGLLGGLFLTRGIYLGLAGRRPQAIAYIREAARLVTQAGDTLSLGRTFLNLAHELSSTDPAAAAETARTAIGHLRRTGARDYLAVGVANLSQALLMLGDWDAAEAELGQAADADGLAGNEILVVHQAWLAAVRGDADQAQTLLTALPDLRASEEPQTQALLALVAAFAAAARPGLADTLSRARATLAYIGAVGAAHEATCWTWPLAARTAWQLADTATAGDLLAMLDAHQPGQLPPMLRAERDLARARLASENSENGDELAAAITGIREHSTPYYVAHALLDHAQLLARSGRAEAAAQAVDEATAIAVQLRCQPLLDRAAAVKPDLTAAAGARPRTHATGSPT